MVGLQFLPGRILVVETGNIIGLFPTLAEKSYGKLEANENKNEVNIISEVQLKVEQGKLVLNCLSV